MIAHKVIQLKLNKLKLENPDQKTNKPHQQQQLKPVLF